MTKNPDFSLRVLHVTSELAPLIKTGGLGDVAGALPKALRRCGADARAVVPAWPGVLDTASELGYLRKRPLGQISVAIDYRAYTAKIWKAIIEEVPTYIIDQPELFNHEQIYPESMDSAAANPFIFLSLSPLELPIVTGWKPQLLHAHDWPTAVLPAALRWHKYYARKSNGDYDTVFTIHNIAHQGIFDPTGLDGWGLSRNAFNPFDPYSLEFYGRLNLMKGALIACDAITTVSPRYSREIQTPDFGFGLDGVIRANKHKLRGIINGIDRDIWNPATDKFIAQNYSADDLAGKTTCREAIFKKFGWDDDGRPLLAFVGRLAEQKGLDIMIEALETLLPQKNRVVVIGEGNEYYHRRLSDLAERYSDSICAITSFCEETAHTVYAGSDIFLMPSLFEPCGLSQLIACAYGTIPVAHATGGLADTVFDADSSADGTGFLFMEHSASELLYAVERAIKAKSSSSRWESIMHNAMKKDFSWETSAAEYMNLYNYILVS